MMDTAQEHVLAPKAATVIEVPLPLYTDLVRSLAVRKDFVDPCAVDATFENETRVHR